MNGFLMLAVAVATTTNTEPAVADQPTDHIVATCYLRKVDFSQVDQAQPDKLFPSGAHRLLVASFEMPTADAVDGSLAEGNANDLHDPTSILLGHAIARVFRSSKEGGYGFAMDTPSEKDSLVMITEQPEPGKTSVRAQVIRAQEGQELSYMFVGRCGILKSENPSKDFEGMKSLPSERQ
jgi:hypothetical protein